MSPSSMSRSQVRYAKRKHTLRCLRAGIVIAKERNEVHEQLLHVLEHDAAAVLETLAIHKLDCKNLGTNVHFASLANALAHQYGCKSEVAFKEHKCVHKAANLVKHEHAADLGASLMPPPPPPPVLLEDGIGKFDGGVSASDTSLAERGILCHNLEDFRRKLYAAPVCPGFNGTLIDEASMVFSLQEDDLSGPTGMYNARAYNITYNVTDPIENAGNVTDPFGDSALNGGVGACLATFPIVTVKVNEPVMVVNEGSTVTDAEANDKDKALGIKVDTDPNAEANDKDLGSKVVTGPKDNNVGKTVTVDEANDLDSKVVTDPIDNNVGSTLAEANAWSKYADLIDRNSKGLRLLQVQAACNPGNDELVAQARVACCSHRQLLRMLMVQQGASNSIIAAFNAVCLYISTFSSKHRMKKYKFYRTFKLRPRPIVKPHPHRQLPKYWVGCLPNLHASASVLPSIKDELYFYLLKRELEFVELGRYHPRRTQTEKQRYSKAVSAMDIWHILEKSGR